MLVHNFGGFCLQVLTELLLGLERGSAWQQWRAMVEDRTEERITVSKPSSKAYRVI